MALLSPEGPPASHAVPVRGRFELPLNSGGHRLDRKHCRVQGGEGHLEADSLVGRCGHAVPGNACQAEGWVDVVPWVHGHHVAEASAQSDEAEGDGSVAVVDPEDQRHG